MLSRLISTIRLCYIGRGTGMSVVEEKEVGQRRRLMISVRVSSKVVVVARIHKNKSLRAITLDL